MHSQARPVHEDKVDISKCNIGVSQECCLFVETHFVRSVVGSMQENLGESPLVEFAGEKRLSIPYNNFLRIIGILSVITEYYNVLVRWKEKSTSYDIVSFAYRVHSRKRTALFKSYIPLCIKPLSNLLTCVWSLWTWSSPGPETSLRNVVSKGKKY